MESRTAYDACPPPTPEPRPPVVFEEDLAPQDRDWLISHLLHQSKVEGIASKRAKRAGDSGNALQHLENSGRFHRLAQALKKVV